MVIKEKEKELSFLFSESDTCFEMGYLIWQQADLEGVPLYRRTTVRGREKLSFLTEGLQEITDILPDFTRQEIIDAVYEIVKMVERVEENGFLKKECIWCERIYYDKEAHKVFMIVLPITQEFRYTDSEEWFVRFEKCLMQITVFLPEKEKQRIQQLFIQWKENTITTATLLEKIGGLGCRVLEKKSMRDSEYLELTYTGKEGKLQFTVGEEDFVIGRGQESTGGILQLSVMVSRVHCLITKINGRYFVQDLAAVNGTWVNETKIPLYELMELEQDDVLRLADVELRVKMVGGND